jgi:hypothetical protein
LTGFDRCQKPGAKVRERTGVGFSAGKNYFIMRHNAAQRGFIRPGAARVGLNGAKFRNRLRVAEKNNIFLSENT